MQKQSCHVNDLPEEIIGEITEFVGLDFLSLLQYVSTFFRQVCLRHWAKDDADEQGSTFTIHPFFSSLTLLNWVLTEGGYPESLAARPFFLAINVAYHGNIEAMKWLRTRDPSTTWNSECCQAAVGGGQLEMLQWLRGQSPPCPWDQATVEAARGHLDTLLWMQSLPAAEVPLPLEHISAYVEDAVWELGDALVEERDFGPMIELMAKTRSTAGSEEVLGVCFSMLLSRVEVDDPIVNEHIEFIGPFALEALRSPCFNTAMSAVMLLNEIIIKRPYFLVKKNMIKMLVDGFTETFACDVWFHSLTEQKEKNMEQVKVLDRTVLCIDCMAQQVPTKSFVKAAMSKFHQCQKSSDPLMRKAGYVMLGTITEGCADAVRLMLPTLLPHLIEAVGVPNCGIREGAMFALLQMAQHCFPTVLYHHEIISSAINVGLDDFEPTVQRLACRLAEYFYEQLQPNTVALYLPELMPRLLSLIKSPIVDVKCLGMGAIGPIAAAAGKLYLPYLSESVANLSAYFDMDAENDLDGTIARTNGQAIEALGQFAFAIGRDDFAPYLNLAMTTVITLIRKNIEEDTPTLEFGYIFVANIAQAMASHEPFKEHMDTIFPYLTRSILTSDQETNQVAALLAIGSFSRYSLGGFFNHLDSAIETLESVVMSPNVNVQGNALKILFHFVAVAGAHDGLTNPAFKKGEIIPIRGRVSITLHRVMEWLWTVISTSTFMVPVSSALEALRGIIAHLGVAVMSLRDVQTFQTYGDLYKDKLLEYLEGKAPCQLSQKSENDADGEDDHHDKHALPLVCEVIEVLAKASGEAYLETFELYIPLLLKFTEEGRSFNDSSMAVGCFANSMSEIGEAAMKHVDLVLPVLRRDCRDVIEENRRNACYCLAVIIGSLPFDTLERYVPDILRWLSPLLVRSSGSVKSGDMGDADVDNAVAAVSRLIMRCPEHGEVPQLLRLVLAALPLTSDFLESEVVFDMLIQLISTTPPAPYTIANFVDIVKSFAHLISDASLYPAAVAEKVKACVARLASSTYQGPFDMRQAMKSLPKPDAGDSR